MITPLNLKLTEMLNKYIKNQKNHFLLLNKHVLSLVDPGSTAGATEKCPHWRLALPPTTVSAPPLNGKSWIRPQLSSFCNLICKCPFLFIAENSFFTWATNMFKFWKKLKKRNPEKRKKRKKISEAEEERILSELCQECLTAFSSNQYRLNHASRIGHTECVKILLQTRVDVNEKVHGDLALVEAAEKGHHEIIDALIEAGADVDLKNQLGYTALSSASFQGHDKCLHVLVQGGADVNEYGYKFKRPLIIAAEWGKPKCVEVLLELGADVNARIFGDTALVFAISNNHYKCVDKLIATEADVNIPGFNYITALMIASRDGRHKYLNQLLKAGADVNKQDTNGNTALLYAVKAGNVEFFDALIKAGADVNKQDSNGSTALILALDIIGYKSFILFIKAGADVNKQRNDGQTALEIAFAKNYDHTCQVLLAAGARISGRDFHLTSLLNSLWPKDAKLNLKHQCRDTIRKHLMKIDPHENLFRRIPQIGLPSSLTKYLLYDVCSIYLEKDD